MLGELKEPKNKARIVLQMTFVKSYDDLMYFYLIGLIILVFFV